MDGYSLSNEESQGVAEKIQDAEQKLKDAAGAMNSLLLHLQSEYVAISDNASRGIKEQIISIESCNFQLRVQRAKLRGTKRIFE